MKPDNVVKTSIAMPALLVIEQDEEGFSSINFKVLGALARLREFVTLDIDVLVVGCDCADVAKVATTLPGIRQVMVANGVRHEHLLPETLAPWLATLAQNYGYVCVGATTFGKSLLPRVGALMDVQPITDVVSIESANEFKRPIYAGSALARVQTDQPIKLLSLRASAFSEVLPGASCAPIVSIAPPRIEPSSRLLSQQTLKSERPPLSSARIVVSGGGGLQTDEGVRLLHQLADKLGAGIGASRAAIDAGFIASDMQVGQTGKVIAPELYIAVGLSGAVQHLAGMRDSRVVVAINKDPNAPIFQAADYGLVGDLFDVVPELIASL